MKALRNIIILTLVMGLTAYAGTKVRVDHNQNVSFEHLKTYSWADQVKDNELDRALSGPLVSDRIRKAIETELADMGYEKAGRGEADFLINYQVSTEEKTKVTTSGSYYGSGYYGSGYHGSSYRGGSYHGHGYHGYSRFGYGYGGHSRSYRHGYGHGFGYGHSYGYGGFDSAPIVHEYLQVTLTLDIIDAHTGTVMWRGWAIKSLDQHPKPKRVRKLISRSVHKILKEFPSEYVHS